MGVLGGCGSEVCAAPVQSNFTAVAHGQYKQGIKPTFMKVQVQCQTACGRCLSSTEDGTNRVMTCVHLWLWVALLTQPLSAGIDAWRLQEQGDGQTNQATRHGATNKTLQHITQQHEQ